MATSDRICLVVVFNHRYDQNIEKLLALYRGRFAHVAFLVPGYTGDRPDVVPVLENCNSFQGYFSQAFPRLHRPGEFSHYVFLGDDLVLAGDLDAATLPAALRLDERSGYIKSLTPVCHGSFKWVREHDVIARMNGDPGWARYAHLMPAPDDFAARLRRHGLDAGRRAFSLANLKKRSEVNVGGRYGPYRGLLGDLLTTALPIGWARRLAAGKVPLLSRLARSSLRRRELPVPLVSGYSDLVVVPAPALPEFARACGVLAAMNLFVEVAVPTALALTVERIVTERDLPRRGRELWDAREVAALEAACGRAVARLPAEWLYVHPVKLSRWSVEPGPAPAAPRT